MFELERLCCKMGMAAKLSYCLCFGSKMRKKRLFVLWKLNLQSLSPQIKAYSTKTVLLWDGSLWLNKEEHHQL
jgi:hypothetical protein